MGRSRVVLCILVSSVALACGKPSDPAKGADPKPASPPSAPIDSRLVGTWSTSHASWNMLEAGAQGSEKHEYVFSPDGSYTYRAEAYLVVRAGQWFLVTERGTLAVAGDHVAIVPSEIEGVIKNADGDVVETLSIPLDRVTYRWDLHLFEGIGETQLVLTPIDPAGETRRDGPYASNGLFPTSYLLSPKDTLEWRAFPK